MRRSKSRESFVIILFLIATAASLNAQEKNQSEHEKMYQKYMRFASYVKGGSIDPHWMADKNSFWYAEGFPDETVIYKVDPVTNTKQVLFDAERLRTALKPLLGHEPPYKGLPFNNFSFINEEKAIKFSVEGKEFVCQLENYSISAVSALSKDEKNRTVPKVVQQGWYSSRPDVYEVLSPDGGWFLGEVNHNLYLRSTYDGRSEPLTTDGIEDQEWSVQGAKWSADSFKVAVTKVDARDLLRVPVVHWLKPTEEVEWIPYTKAGGPMSISEIFIIDILSKHQVHVDLGNTANHYISLVDWQKDRSEMFLTKAHREWKKQELIAANPKTGETRVILTETAKTFVGGLSKTHIPFFLEEGKKFIWLAERDGWAHLYLYNIDGTLIRRLTSGTFPVVRVIAVDEEKGWVYFTAHAEERLYDTHLYRVNLQGKGFARLTEATGQHSIVFSPSKEFFLDTHSTAGRPPSVELRKADGTQLQTISKANIDGLKELKWSPPEEFIVKAADKETDLYGIMFKPYDFDPTKKYAVLDHIYNGPYRTQVARRFIGRGLWAQAMAQLGFVVIMVDGRGTTERGKEFQDVVYHNFGRNEIPDHVAALKQLARDRPYIDMERIGIFGGSWGGYMTTRAMVLAPEVYKVGVSIYPVVDLYDHNALAIEYYMGLPQNNKEAYDYASSIRLADKLTGKLLLIHGTADINATFSATMKMVEAFVRANKPFDLIVLPDLDHSITGQSGKYILDSTKRYFQEHLRPRQE